MLDNKHIVAHFLDMEKNLEGLFIVQTFCGLCALKPTNMYERNIPG
jgi:hypothetical protein